MKTNRSPIDKKAAVFKTAVVAAGGEVVRHDAGSTRVEVRFPGCPIIAFSVGPDYARYRRRDGMWIVFRNEAKYRGNLEKLAVTAKSFTEFDAVKAASIAAVRAQLETFKQALKNWMDCAGIDFARVTLTDGMEGATPGAWFLIAGAETRVYGFSLRYSNFAVRADFMVATVEEAIAKIEALEAAFPKATVPIA